MKKDLSSAEVEAMLAQLEQRLQRLRALYEQYFMGIERIPPRTARKEVVRMIHRLEQTHVRNTALKFRQRSLVQRFNSYKAYWNRVEREIEEGTYKRDRQRADRNKERRAAREEARDQAHVIDMELDEIESLEDLQAELEAMDQAGAFDRHERQPGESAPSRPRPAASNSEGGPPSSAGSQSQSQLDADKLAKLKRLKSRLDKKADLPTGGANIDKIREMAAHKDRLQREQRNRRAAAQSDDSQARAVYNKLLEAKRRCNEATNNISYESVAQSMQKQRDHLKSSRGARDVDFKVVIKDGKAFLKPVPK